MAYISRGSRLKAHNVLVLKNKRGMEISSVNKYRPIMDAHTTNAGLIRGSWKKCWIKKMVMIMEKEREILYKNKLI